MKRAAGVKHTPAEIVGSFLPWAVMAIFVFLVFGLTGTCTYLGVVAGYVGYLLYRRQRKPAGVKKEKPFSSLITEEDAERFTDEVQRAPQRERLERERAIRGNGHKGNGFTRI